MQSSQYVKLWIKTQKNQTHCEEKKRMVIIFTTLTSSYLDDHVMYNYSNTIILPCHLLSSASPPIENIGAAIVQASSQLFVTYRLKERYDNRTCVNTLLKSKIETNCRQKV